MSGLLGDVLGGLLENQKVGKPSALQGILQEVLSGGQGQGGGIAALLSRFESAGLGDKARSWVSDDENKPVSADEVGRVFSSDELQQWARQAGTTPAKMKDVLAQVLPHVVDDATPNGQVPAGVPDLSGLLGNLLGRFANR